MQLFIYYLQMFCQQNSVNNKHTFQRFVFVYFGLMLIKGKVNY
jgi:hypothetical protein